MRENSERGQKMKKKSKRRERRQKRKGVRVLLGELLLVRQFHVSLITNLANFTPSLFSFWNMILRCFFFFSQFFLRMAKNFDFGLIR